jgi:hypothetical protein
MDRVHRLRARLAAEEGSFLIEALVCAAILLVVGAGVVLALQTAHAETGLQRSKAIANDVAQTKLDELRSRAYNNLRGLNETTTVTEGGIPFTVVSTASPVSQANAPSGCAAQRARDYMSLRTTVSWAEMQARKPVSLTTLVAAPVGAGGGFVVSVTGANGQAIPGVPFLLSGGLGVAISDATGCARWDAGPAGTNLALTATLPGYVLPNGEANISLTGLSIVAEQTTQQSIAYDLGGSALIRFQQTRADGTVGDVAASAVPADVSLSNSNVTVTHPVVGTTGGTGYSGLYYPYTTPYAAYADSCPAARPTDAARTAAITIQRGVQSARADLLLPSLNVKVTGGDRVRIKTACGTVIQRPVDAGTGLLTDPGLPYGENFTVCAQNTLTGRVKVVGNIDNTTYAAPGTSPTTIAVPANGMGGSCGF